LEDLMKLIRFAAVPVLVASFLCPVLAENPALAKENAGKAKGSAGTLTKTVPLAPKGLRWGMSLEAIAKLYDDVIEQEMLPLLRRAQPGPELDAVHEELRIKKGVLRRSRVEFGDVPTGVDYTPLKGEYSYRNGESMAALTLRSGTKRHFFFFNDQLWKVYDEHTLKAGSALGANFEEAIKNLTKRFGAPPKRTAADPAKGQMFDEAEWRDDDKVIRAVDRGDILAMVYAERRIQENLARYRPNKPVDAHALDADVAAVTKKQEPKEPEKDAKGAKSKKK